MLRYLKTYAVVQGLCGVAGLAIWANPATHSPLGGFNLAVIAFAAAIFFSFFFFVDSVVIAFNDVDDSLHPC